MAADVQDDEIFVNERSGGDAPVRHVDAVLLIEVLLPQDLSAGRIEDVQPASRAQGVGLALMDRHGGPRPGRILDAAVGALVLMRPHDLAGFFIEAMDRSLVAGL